MRYWIVYFVSTKGNLQYYFNIYYKDDAFVADKLINHIRRVHEEYNEHWIISSMEIQEKDYLEASSYRNKNKLKEL